MHNDVGYTLQNFDSRQNKNFHQIFREWILPPLWTYYKMPLMCEKISSVILWLYIPKTFL
jgi:hypothetical protein